MLGRDCILVTLLLTGTSCTGEARDPSGTHRQDPDTTSPFDTSDTAGDSGSGSARDSTTDTPPVTDADEDGHDAASHGGDDCDDSSFHVYPGATEYCDTVDQDCDGEPMPGTGCTEEIPIGAAGTLLVDSIYIGSTPFLIGDVTGDGVNDLARFRYFDSDILLYSGGRMPEVPYGDTTEEAWHRIQDPGAWVSIPDAGDVNGDGWGDLVVVNYEGAGIQVRYGPLEEGGDSHLWDDGVWLPDYFLGEYTTCTFSGVDLDGDGLTDLGTSDQSGVAYARDNLFEVYFGGSEQRCSYAGESDPGVAGGKVIGDGDGDGLPETAWQWDGGSAIWILAGADTRSACDGWLTDHAVGSMPRAEGEVWLPMSSIGDWTGDGLDEFPITSLVPRVTEVDEGLRVMSAAQAVAGEFRPDDRVGGWVLTEEDWGAIYAPTTSADIDGDGKPDLIGMGRSYHIIPSSTDLGPAAELPNERLRLEYMAFNGTGDFDGDGFDDLLFTDVSTDPLYTKVLLLPGWDVPWEDPTRW